MIGKKKSVPLRDVWKHEAKDFTTWLANNLDELPGELGMQLSFVQREAKLGDFFVDLVAKDTLGRRVVIENQLKQTDHEHLGKLITYMCNANAHVAIWISEKPRPDHMRAVEWLNEATDYAFYLMKVEAFQIDNGNPAPFFTIKSGPSLVAKRDGEAKRAQEHGDRRRWTFWNGLLERAKAKTNLHANIRASNGGWVGTGAGGKGLEYNYVIGKDWARVELYFDSGDEKINKPIFDALSRSKERINRAFGESLNWDRRDGKKACRISKCWKGKGLAHEDDWPKIQDKMIEGMIRLEAAMRGPIAALPR
jgi:hypothetical protein